MKLDRNIINELAELLKPLMEDERSRRSTLISALGNNAPVLQHMTWSGSVRTFIPEMVCQLADYGEIEPGKQALWALLEYVRSQVGINVQQRIDNLRPLIDVRSHFEIPTDPSSDIKTSNAERLVKLEEVFQSKQAKFTPETSIATMPSPKRDQVFISYSHKDKVWLDKLQTMLKPLMRNKTISVWDDTRIKPGAKWNNEITQALAAAKVAVLMVSSNFLASDFIAEKELPPLLNAAEQEGLTIIWVYLSACWYEESEIGEYQAAHDTAEPLDTLEIGAQNQVLLRICKAIKAAATETSANP